MMSRIETILEECLEQIARGESSLEDCLQRYPKYSEELRPLLMAASKMRQFSDVEAPPEQTQQGRAELMSYMHLHPRRKVKERKPGFIRLTRLAAILTVLAVAILATGTAFAQSALPGDPLYGWKLTSEAAWLWMSPNPVKTNLAISDRRIQEILGSTGPDRDLALSEYQQVLNRLANQADPEVQENIRFKLSEQDTVLTEAGISVNELNDYLSTEQDIKPTQEPTDTENISPTQGIINPLPALIITPTLTLELPEADDLLSLSTPTP